MVICTHRTQEQLKQRLAMLQDALLDKVNLDDEIAELERWLMQTDEDVRQLNRNIGHKEEDAAKMLARAQVNWQC